MIKLIFNVSRKLGTYQRRFHFFLNFFFENVMAPAAGYADFAAAFRSTEALLAAWTLKVSEVFSVTLQVCTDFVSDKGAVPVVFCLPLGQFF